MERGGNSVVARKRGGELTSRNVAARIGSKVETRVRLDCHPESILITATSQPLFLRRFYHRFSLFLDRERNSPLFELKSMAFREILVLLPPPNGQAHSLPPSWLSSRLRSFTRRGEERNFRETRRSRRKFGPRFSDSSGNRHEGASFNPPSSRMLDDQQSIKA